MKPFLGIDITQNKKNEQFNGDEFVTATVSSVQSESFENAAEKAVNLVEKAKLPLPIRIGHWICGFAGVIIVIGIINAIIDDNMNLSTAYANAPLLFWVAGVCLAVWLVLTIVSNKKMNKVMGSDEGNYIISNLDAVAQNIYNELEVPADAATVDILSFTYKIKDGEPIPKDTGITAFENLENRAFVRDGYLFIADLKKKYAFPLSEIKAIHTIKKKISIPGWNKDVPCNQGIYKPYKMKTDNYECIHLKPYHILEIDHQGEIWGIYFPCYECPAFEELTGLKAEP